MTTRSAFFAFFWVLIVCVVGANVTPSYSSEPCSKSDKNFDTCFSKTLEKIGPYLIKGIPQAGLDKLDPLEISDSVFDQTLNELLYVKAYFTNIKLTGLKNTILDGFRADPEEMSIELNITIPHINLAMEFTMFGKVLTLDLTNSGYTKGNFSNISNQYRITFETIEKNDVKYYKIKKFSMDSQIGGGFIRVKSRNAQLQNTANILTNFFNANPRGFMEAVYPLYINYASNFYRTLLERLLEAVPAEELAVE